MLSGILQAALGTGAGLNGTSCAELDWQQLEAQLTRHGLTAVAYAVLERHGVEIPPESRERMRSQARLAPCRCRLIGELLDDVAAVFAAAQAPAVLLGGTGLLRLLHADAMYPIPDTVEMLVAEEHRAVAERQLRLIGFRRENTLRSARRSAFFPGTRGSIPFVLSSQLFDSPQRLVTAEAIQANLRAADRLPGVLRTMSPEDELIYLCLRVQVTLDQMRASASCSPPHIPWREVYNLAACVRQADTWTDFARFVVEARGRGVADRVASSLTLCAQACSVNLPARMIRGLVDDPAVLSPALRQPACSQGARPPQSRRDERPISYISAETLVHPDRRPGLRMQHGGDERVTFSDPCATFSTTARLGAAVVLEWCDGKHSVESITEMTACRFDVDPAQVSADVRRVIESSVRKGLLRVRGASITDHRLSFPIVNRHGRWADRLSNRYCTSRYIDWRSLRRPEEQGEMDEVLSFTQFDLEDAHLYRGRRKVAWMREPRPIAWWTYDALERHIDEFDTVLTYEMELLDKYPAKCVYCPGGGSHIEPADFRVHPKCKLVSFIASAKRFRAPGHLARHEFWELVKPGRPDLTRQMLNGRDVDCYGPLVDNPIEDKLDSLKDYMFQIAIENVICDTYFTEKLIDCFLTGTIPIYRGSRRAAQFFDADGILFYSSTEELFAILRRLKPDDYARRLPHVHRNFELAQRYTHAVDWVYEHTDVFRL